MSEITDPDVLSTMNDGDTAWILTSAALVYLMTPGLAFFYGGLVSSKHVLNTLFMSFVCMGVISLQWVLFGYSFAFDLGTEGWGTFNWGVLNNWDQGPNETYAGHYPFLAHFAFQGAFAVITPALISGAIVGRMKFGAYIIFITLWSTLCYDALAHWIWAPSGWLFKLGAIDFAGGTVIHISSGFSALVATMIVGPRAQYKEEKQAAKSGIPMQKELIHVPFTVLGASLLWIGWFGFNAGSALAGNGLAALAFVNTHVAAATAMVSWMVLESIFSGKITVTGACCGAVVGLVNITPACGYVVPGWSILIGVIGAAASFGSIRLRMRYFHNFDDTLDVFSCHGVGGVVGALLTGLFAELRNNSLGKDGGFYGGENQFGYQLAAVAVTIGYSCGITAGLLLILKYTIGVRVSHEHEQMGLDEVMHGEVWTHPHTTSPKSPESFSLSSPLQASVSANNQVSYGESTSVVIEKPILDEHKEG